MSEPTKNPPQLAGRDGLEAVANIATTPERSPTAFDLATRVTPFEVAAECKRVIGIEGSAHVYGHYIADFWDAAIARAEKAERRLRAIKAAEFHASHCTWCEQENRGPMVSVGGDRFVHAEKCLAEVVAFLEPESLVAVLSRDAA